MRSASQCQQVTSLTLRFRELGLRMSWTSRIKNRSGSILAHFLADEESPAWIPGRLMHDAGQDPAAITALLAGPFRDGIFPAKLSSAAAARHWVVIYQV